MKFPLATRLTDRPTRRSRAGFALGSWLVLVLAATPLTATAESTGVAFEFGSVDSDWEFSDEVRQSKSEIIGLQIEERVATGLSIGAGFNYHSLRLDGANGGDSNKFEVTNFQLYFRKEIPVSESLSLEGLFSYGYYTGRENVSSDRAELDYTQLGLEFGIGIRAGDWKFTPYAVYNNVDGDTSGLEDSGEFELEDPFSAGIRFDRYFDPTAFVSLRYQSGSQTGGYLSFVKRY